MDSNETLPLLPLSMLKSQVLQALQTKGVNASLNFVVVEGAEAEEYITATPVSIVEALSRQQDSERLPWQLMRLVEEAQQGTLHLTVEGLNRPTGQYVFMMAMNLLLGWRVEETLQTLWSLYGLRQQTSRVN